MEFLGSVRTSHGGTAAVGQSATLQLRQPGREKRVEMSTVVRTSYNTLDYGQTDVDTCSTCSAAALRIAGEMYEEIGTGTGTETSFQNFE